MPQTISQHICSYFFESLTYIEAITPETIEALKALHMNNRLANGRELAKLVQEIEERYAHHQDANG